MNILNKLPITFLLASNVDKLDSSVLRYFAKTVLEEVHYFMNNG